MEKQMLFLAKNGALGTLICCNGKLELRGDDGNETAMRVVIETYVAGAKEYFMCPNRAKFGEFVNAVYQHKSHAFRRQFTLLFARHIRLSEKMESVSLSLPDGLYYSFATQLEFGNLFFCHDIVREVAVLFQESDEYEEVEMLQELLEWCRESMVCIRCGKQVRHDETFEQSSEHMKHMCVECMKTCLHETCCLYNIQSFKTLGKGIDEDERFERCLMYPF